MAAQAAAAAPKVLTVSEERDKLVMLLCTFCIDVAKMRRARLYDALYNEAEIAAASAPLALQMRSDRWVRAETVMERDSITFQQAVGMHVIGNCPILEEFLKGGGRNPGRDGLGKWNGCV